jgi:hypothetical protein
LFPVFVFLTRHNRVMHVYHPTFLREHRHRSPESKLLSLSITPSTRKDPHHYPHDDGHLLRSVHLPFFYVIARFSVSRSIKAYVLYSIMYEHTADQLREATGLLSDKLPTPPAHTMRSTSYNTSIASRRSVAPISKLMLDANTGACAPGLASG